MLLYVGPDEWRTVFTELVRLETSGKSSELSIVDSALEHRDHCGRKADLVQPLDRLELQFEQIPAAVGRLTRVWHPALSES